MRGKNVSTIFDSQCRKEEEKTRRERERERESTIENTKILKGGAKSKVGAREARTLDLRISRSYETYALANCATAPGMNSGVLF
jgi:hypothetical protein